MSFSVSVEEQAISDGFSRELTQNDTEDTFSRDDWRVEIYPKQLKDGIYFYWHFRARTGEKNGSSGRKRYQHINGGRTDKAACPFTERVTEYTERRAGSGRITVSSGKRTYEIQGSGGSVLGSAA